MDVLRKFILVFVFVFLLSDTSFADWYILLPKKPLPRNRKIPKNVPIPKLKGKVQPKPYSVEVQKVLAPAFSIPTRSGKLTKEDLEGKNVVIFFVKSLFSPFTEKLVSMLERSDRGKTVFVVVSTSDADFVSIDTFKRLMGVKKTVVTADSYLFYQFRLRLRKLKTPSVVVIDKYGFIRFFSPKLSGVKVSEIDGELSSILSLLKG